MPAPTEEQGVPDVILQDIQGRRKSPEKVVQRPERWRDLQLLA